MGSDLRMARGPELQKGDKGNKRKRWKAGWECYAGERNEKEQRTKATTGSSATVKAGQRDVIAVFVGDCAPHLIRRKCGIRCWRAGSGMRQHL